MIKLKKNWIRLAAVHARMIQQMREHKIAKVFAPLKDSALMLIIIS